MTLSCFLSWMHKHTISWGVSPWDFAATVHFSFEKWNLFHVLARILCASIYEAGLLLYYNILTFTDCRFCFRMVENILSAENAKPKLVWTNSKISRQTKGPWNTTFKRFCRNWTNSLHDPFYTWKAIIFHFLECATRVAFSSQGGAARQNADENIDMGSHVNINYHWINMVECNFMQSEM